MLQSTILERPFFTAPKRDIPAGTLLRVTLKNKTIWEGQVHQNPLQCSPSSSVSFSLVNPFCSSNGIKVQFKNIMPIREADIDQIEILSQIQKKVIKEKRVEITCPSVVVDTLNKYYNALKHLKDLEKAIGFCLLGHKYGRSERRVYWIAISAKNIFIAINMKALEDEHLNQKKERPKKKHQNKHKSNSQNTTAIINHEDSSPIWNALDKAILSNEKILKLVYNGLATSDYLFHNHCITMKNVFDFQVANIAIMRRKLENIDLFEAKFANGKNKRKYPTLGQTLKNYLPNKVISEEIKLLDEVDKEEWNNDNPFDAKIPEDKYRKYAAIQVKYLKDLYKIMYPPIFNVCGPFSEFVVNLAKRIEMGDSWLNTSRPTEIPKDVQEYARNLSFEIDGFMCNWKSQ